MSRRSAVPALLVLLAVVVAGPGAGTSRGSGPTPRGSVQRVLIVSLPGVAWDDVSGGPMPAMRSLVSESAIGALSTRIGRRGASTTDAYLSIGAGTRAIAPSVDVAVAVEADESYGGVRTEDILRRRLGRVPSGIAYLAVGAAQNRNDTSGFGARPGRLGGLLSKAGVDRAVIANADAAEGFPTDEPPPDGAYARGAVTALMGPDGIVPTGTVGRRLLRTDPEAPFGHRLDHTAVLDAFDSLWSGTHRAVVLVEASDLSRASAYAPRTTPRQAKALRTDALITSDALLDQLVRRLDPTTDALLVVSPVAASASPELAVALLRAPGVDRGMLRSATTRRDGYVQLADIAPTVLSLLGEPEPEEIEGRSIEARRSSKDRVATLIGEAAAAARRDDLMPIVVPSVIGVLAVLAAATIVARRRHQPWGATLRFGALVSLGMVPATFAASHLRVAESVGAYLAVSALLAVAVGAGLWTAEHRWPGVGPLLGTGAIVGLFVTDVLLGAPLQVNAVFGYSLAVAGRFVGVGNLAFALFGSATIVTAALLVDRLGRTAVPWAAGLLAGVVLVEGLPMLGADVGGVLSMVPAFGVTALLLAERRLRLLHVVGLIGLAAAAVTTFAFVDLLRDEGSRTHLARLAEHIRDRRWEPVGDSLSRRLQASFGGAELGAWVVVLGLLGVVGAYVVLVQRGWLDPRRLLDQGHRPTTAAAIGLSVLALVGLVANDSSIAVPATMLIVIAPVAVGRAMSPAQAASRIDMDPA